MTIVASDDFTAYADGAALAAVWRFGPDPATVVTWGTSDSGTYPTNYGTVTVGGGVGGATVTLPNATAAHYDNTWQRVFTGLTPGAYYTVTAEVSAAHTAAYFAAALVVSQSNQSFGQSAYVTADGAATLTVTHCLAGSDGALLVRVGFPYGAGGYWHEEYSVTFAAMAIDDGAPAPIFTSSLPIRGVQWDQIAYTAGVITVGGEVIGYTRGALRFDPGETWQPMEYDGNFVPTLASYELVSQRPRFLGSFLPLGPRHLALYLPKSSQSASLDTTVVTPTVPGAVLAQGDYTLNLTVTWPYLSGGTIAVTFPYAFWQKYELDGADKGEVLIPCEILGVPLTTTSAPYHITCTEPGTIS